jgi:hypothetical protein
MRRATLDDLPALLAMRRAMFLDMGHEPGSRGIERVERSEFYNSTLLFQRL